MNITIPEGSRGDEKGEKKVIADASVLIHLSAIGRYNHGGKGSFK